MSNDYKASSQMAHHVNRISLKLVKKNKAIILANVVKKNNDADSTASGVGEISVCVQ